MISYYIAAACPPAVKCTGINIRFILIYVDICIDIIRFSSNKLESARVSSVRYFVAQILFIIIAILYWYNQYQSNKSVGILCARACTFVWSFINSPAPDIESKFEQQRLRVIDWLILTFKMNAMPLHLNNHWALFMRLLLHLCSNYYVNTRCGGATRQ